MCLFKLTSYNPDFSFVISKNPETGMVMREIRKGVAFVFSQRIQMEWNILFTLGIIRPIPVTKNLWDRRANMSIFWNILLHSLCLMLFKNSSLLPWRLNMQKMMNHSDVNSPIMLFTWANRHSKWSINWPHFCLWYLNTQRNLWKDVSIFTKYQSYVDRHMNYSILPHVIFTHCHT